MPIEENSRRGIPVHLDCPHCHNPIELVAGEIEEEVQCPSCGSSFRLDADRTQSWSKDKLATLGKFQLIEPVGRGAFGTVYKAHDTQLHRIVAVKVPRSGQLVTDEDEDRFVREARNAAQLQHPGIVPVYEVGRSDTFPYLVSEFVEGVTLSDTLTARRLGFREAAELIARIAVALQHAHAQGVVHRDLKPSNIMLTGDGTPRVMDFGLAKRDAGEITVTVEGQVLGTPAYMSPEQASGQAHHVDGRSDVYSLGVILFELLTGELPFRGNQRMLLHQVLHDEPRSPRSLNDRISRDLETITLKCLQKDPAKRYQSAAALAADLRRWLAGETIAARPVARWERGWRWARRNPVVASLSASLCLLLIVVAAGSFVAALRIDAERRQAVAARNEAAASATEALQQRDRAEDNFRQARAAVDGYLTQVSQNKLLDVPGLQPLRRELLESALKYYQGFIIERSDDVEVQSELGAAYSRVGEITCEIGSKSDAQASYEKAIEIQERLVRENPAVTTFLNQLGKSYSSLGNLQHRTGQLENAGAFYKRAMDIQAKLVHENPRVTDFENDLANSYGKLGGLQRQTAQLNEAAKSYEKEMEIKERLVRENPTIADFQNDLANSYGNLAGLQHQRAQLGKVAKSYEKAIEIHERLVREYPHVTDFKMALATNYHDLGSFQTKISKLDQAARSHEQAIEIHEGLVRENPSVTDFQMGLASAYRKLGSLRHQTGQMDEAATLDERAVEIHERLVRENPTVINFQKALASSYNSLGISRRLTGQLDKAARCGEQAMEIQEKLSREYPDVAAFRIGKFAQINLLYLRIVMGKGEPEQNLVEAQAIVTKERGVSISLFALGAAHYRAGNYEQALNRLKLGADQVQTGVQFKIQNPYFGDEYRAVGLLFSAMAHHRLHDPDKARVALNQSLALIEKLTPCHAAGLPSHLLPEAEALINAEGKHAPEKHAAEPSETR